MGTGGVEAGTRQAMKSVEAILDAAGSSFEDVIKAPCSSRPWTTSGL